MHLGPLIQEHGYWLSFVGSLFEGETALTLAGLAAHRGYLNAPMLIALGAAGSFIGDQIFFLIGRRFGGVLLQRFPRLKPSARRVNSVVLRFSRTSIIVVRFLYGLRTIGPVVIGMSSIPWHTFALFNAIGAVIWAACWVMAGYLLGNVAQLILGDLARVEKWLFVSVLLAAIAAVVVLHLRRRTAGTRSGG